MARPDHLPARDLTLAFSGPRQLLAEDQEPRRAGLRAPSPYLLPQLVG